MTNTQYQPCPTPAPPVSVESLQPAPDSQPSPNFKAERTTHGSQPTQPSPLVVHSAAKIETYSNQIKAESTPNLQVFPALSADASADRYLKKALEKPPTLMDTSRLPRCFTDYLDVARRYTDAQDGALLTAFLPVLAVNIGNRVFIRNKGKQHYAQFWAVLVGPSSISRKSTCIRLAVKTLEPHEQALKQESQEIRTKQTLVISNATNAKTISMLSKNSTRLFEMHEFATLLKAAKHTYNAGLKESLTMLYDGDSKNVHNMERSEYIDRPAISILGATTEGWIIGDFQSAAEQNSGFLQRFNYCIIKAEKKPICSNPNEQEPDYRPLNAYDTIFATFREIAGHQELKMSVENRAYWLEEHDRILNDILETENDELLAYATRIYNNVFNSLCIMITLMKSLAELRSALDENRVKGFFAETWITRETIEEALSLCGFYLDNARPMLGIITEGGNWSNERRIVKFLDKQADKKALHSSVMKKLHMKARELNECIRNLAEMNIVELQHGKIENCRPSILYCLKDNSYYDD